MLMPDRKMSHNPTGRYNLILSTRYILSTAIQKKMNENSGEGYFPGRSSKQIVPCKKDFRKIIISSAGTYDERAIFAASFTKQVISG